jgi:hypothetical protein
LTERIRWTICWSCCRRCAWLDLPRAPALPAEATAARTSIAIAMRKKNTKKPSIL